MSPARTAALILALAAASVAVAADKDRMPRVAGYLPEGTFDIVPVLPSPPATGDARDKADRRIFRETRRLIGTPRYALATNDAIVTPPALMRDLSCAVGVALTPANAPRTAAIGMRAVADTGRRNSDAKDVFRRRRPFLVDKGEICQSKAQLAGSFDYPSGHATYGWTWGLVLADLLPDRAPAILARARAYGDSRFVCGAHNLSAVEASAISATATMAAVRQTPAYQADLPPARAELRALLADPAAPKPTGCEEERRLVAQPVP